MLFTLGAGSFLLNINKNIQTKKTYKLEFVKRKTPPPVKKEKIIERPEIKVASLPMPVPQPKAVVPVLRSAVRQTQKVRQVVTTPQVTPRPMQKTTTTRSAIIRSSTPTVSRRVSTPVARSFSSSTTKVSTKGSTRVAMVRGTRHAPMRKIPSLIKRPGSSATNKKGATRVAMVQGAPETKLGKLPDRVIRPSGGAVSSKTSTNRVSPVSTGVKLASFTSVPTPREVPNIFDKGALKGYIGQVQRIIEGAKRYPEASRRAGRQGKLKVQFTILKNGEVDDIKLLTKTPYPNLNREAMAAIKRAAPFSNIPDSIMRESLKVILPFRFELN